MVERAGRVEGKVVVITGAASGLGAESARRLAREGAALLLTDMAADAGESIAAEIEGAGGRAAFMTLDVTDEAGWATVVAKAMALYGRIDGLVNSAGVAGGAPLMEMSLTDWRRIVGINLEGTFLGMRACGLPMAQGGGGSIVNLSSILGKVGQPGTAAYSASKGGVLMLSKTAALEWAPANIRVNSVHPGYIDTPMVSGALQNSDNGNELKTLLISRHPLGRLGQPREIADAIVFLISDESSFMTGAEMVIDGGYTAQ
jgi:NAD(P)-dependent dehydrogenase (short-subunit alcohol dehydrogenase family)